MLYIDELSFRWVESGTNTPIKLSDNTILNPIWTRPESPAAVITVGIELTIGFVGTGRKSSRRWFI